MGSEGVVGVSHAQNKERDHATLLSYSFGELFHADDWSMTQFAYNVQRSTMIMDEWKVYKRTLNQKNRGKRNKR